MPELELKRFEASLKLLGDGSPEGTVQAMFSPFNKRDEGDDVTLSTFFTDGQPIAMTPWGHNWGDLPPGKGVVRNLTEGAAFDGAFFMDTDSGVQHYRTVKNMGGLQEWSFGFRVLESRVGSFADGNDTPVRYLVRGEIYEVSPVLIGMNRGTYTLGIKGGLPIAEQGDAALAAVRDLLDRSKSLADLRAKDGRVLSEANRKRLGGLLEALKSVQADIEDLLQSTEPPAKGASLLSEFVRYQKITAQLRAIGV
jgi:hypothetical protein